MITYELIGSNGDHIYFDNNQFAVLRDELSGLSGIPCEPITISSPGQIGKQVQSVTVSERNFTVPIAVLGSGRAELEERRERLNRAVNPLNGVITFVWNRMDGLRYLIRAMPEDGSPQFRSGTKPDDKMWPCYLDLVANDPCWYLATELVNPLRGFTGGWHLPLQFPMNFGGIGTTVEINNPGSTESPCTIELRGKLVDPQITNVTTGESITVRRTIEAGETLKINTASYHKTVTHIDINGVETNAMHYVTIQSRFFQIPAGKVKLRYTASEEGNTAIGYMQFVPRWLSL